MPKPKLMRYEANVTVELLCTVHVEAEDAEQAEKLAIDAAIDRCRKHGMRGDTTVTWMVERPMEDDDA